MSLLMSIGLVVQVLSAIALIVLVLLQHGKGADLGAAFGSGASGSIFGAAGSGSFLSKMTWIIGAVFFWTFLIPVACGICYAVLFVVRIICFFSICKGQAKEPPIIRSLGFLR